MEHSASSSNEQAGPVKPLPCLRWIFAWALAGCMSWSASAAPIRYDCDSSPGFFSEIEQFQPGPGYRVRGSIKAQEARKHRRYVPTATIWLQSADKTKSAAVQLMNRSGKKFDLTVITRMDGATIEKRVMQVDVEEVVPFDLHFSPSGRNIIIAGGQSFDVAGNFGTNARVSITCSTGGFEFPELDWNAEIEGSAKLG